MRLLEQIDMAAWQAFRLPEHSYFNIRVIDDGGQELAMARDLVELQTSSAKPPPLPSATTAATSSATTSPTGTSANCPKNPVRPRQTAAHRLPRPATAKNGSIALRLFDTPEAAAAAHRQGSIALMALQLKEQVKDLNKGLPDFTQTAMLLKHLGVDNLREDITAAVLDRAPHGRRHPAARRKSL